MKPQILKGKFLNFFVARKHQILPNLSLVPENDPTALFISAGMQPLVPYLLGEPHPLGKRLASLQRCLRTDDIEEVGDTFHHTFFEMLGNWSLGGYGKKEAIFWAWEFLTKELSLPPQQLSVSVFSGDKDAPRDEQSAQIWQELGLKKEKIFYLGKKDNWWGPVGQTGPCGPDTEIYYDTGKASCRPGCRPGCPANCGKYFEIWNLVFLEYQKTGQGYEPLKQKNVDTGMGVERTLAILEGKENVYETELFTPIMQKIAELSAEKVIKSSRIIADHLRAATFLLADGVTPANVERGYILRRLIRRAIRHGKILGIKENFTPPIAKVVITHYQEDYPHLAGSKEKILEELENEEERFLKTLDRGLKEFTRFFSKIQFILGKKILPGELAFRLYESYGFPLEMTEELTHELGLKVDKRGFKKAFAEHQKRSRRGAAAKFAGGLADHSKIVIQLHTATHLLHQALRVVLGSHLKQSGSQITPERLRFDFTHPQKLTEEEIKKVEALVNQKIQENLPVKMEVVSFKEALKKGALGLFAQKYGEKVKVYSIGEFSKEVCGGPHVDFTGVLKSFRIIKEEAVSSGVRRIYAIVG